MSDILLGHLQMRYLCHIVLEMTMHLLLHLYLIALECGEKVLHLIVLLLVQKRLAWRDEASRQAYTMDSIRVICQCQYRAMKVFTVSIQPNGKCP